MTKTRIWVLSGGILGLFGSAWILWYAIPDQDVFAIAIATAYLIGVVSVVFGMWKHQCWALRMSRALAGIAFVFGCYIAHFAWTFWLFQEPTLKDRILAVLRPQSSLFLIVPVLWLIPSFLPRVKAKFLA